MSSMHLSAGVLQEKEDKKPSVIADYNYGKGGVDLLVSCIEDFTVKRKTNRYPLVIFFNRLDVALYNSYLIFKENSNFKMIDRKQYMKNLSEYLAEENMVERYNNRHTWAQVKDSFRRFGMKPQLYKCMVASESSKVSKSLWLSEINMYKMLCLPKICVFWPQGIGCRVPILPNTENTQSA